MPGCVRLIGSLCYDLAEPEMEDKNNGKLFIVSTPIGNLGDISSRALEVLSSVDLIACEDTRHTQKLLNHFGIKKKTISYHEHNERERSDELAKMLISGSTVALVSDAGTPGISDPGNELVKRAIELGIEVTPIPGAAAFAAAASASGLPTDKIFFEGFLPAKRTERRKRLTELRPIGATLIFYEAPHRIASTLTDCFDILGNRWASLARELTKVHEEFLRGKISSIISTVSSAKARGEYVLIIDRERESDLERPSIGRPLISERIAELEAAGDDRRTALKKAAKEYGLSRSEAYRKLHSEQE